MTYYNYASEMQQLCFRAREALTVLKEDGLKEFYAIAEEGYYNKLENVPVEEAKQNINQSQIDAYLALKDFVETKELEAAEKLRAEQEAKNE